MARAAEERKVSGRYDTNLQHDGSADCGECRSMDREIGTLRAELARVQGELAEARLDALPLVSHVRNQHGHAPIGKQARAWLAKHWEGCHAAQTQAREAVKREPTSAQAGEDAPGAHEQEEGERMSEFFVEHDANNPNGTFYWVVTKHVTKQGEAWCRHGGWQYHDERSRAESEIAAKMMCDSLNMHARAALAAVTAERDEWRKLCVEAVVPLEVLHADEWALERLAPVVRDDIALIVEAIRSMVSRAALGKL